MRRAAGRLLVGATAGIVLAAGLHGLVGSGSDPENSQSSALLGRGESNAGAPGVLEGPDAPQPGVLGGTLFVVQREGCGLAAVDLATLRLSEPTLETACTLSISPDGTRAVVAKPGEAPAGGPRLWLADLGDPPGLVRELGAVPGSVTWSPDGRRLAWCRADASTVVLTPATGRSETVSGCSPSFAASGELLTVSGAPRPAAVLRAGVVVLDGRALRSGFTGATAGRVVPLGVDQRADGLLAVTVTRESRGREVAERQELVQPGPFGSLAEPRDGTRWPVELQLWRDARLERVLPLPPVDYRDSQARFGDLVAFSPVGNEVAVGAGRAGTQLVVIDVRSGRTALPPTSLLGYDWSPDGAWLALVSGEEIVVSGRVRDEPVFRLPVSARAIAWR